MCDGGGPDQAHGVPLQEKREWSERGELREEYKLYSWKETSDKKNEPSRRCGALKPRRSESLFSAGLSAVRVQLRGGFEEEIQRRVCAI